MKKILNFLLIFLLIFPLWLNAQNLKQEESKKLDSVYKTVKKLYDERKNNPLQGKKYGVDFNIPFFLFSFINGPFIFNAGFSIFDTKNKNEYAFPISYEKFSNKSYFSIDGHFRKYLGNTLNGFYIGGFARLAFVNNPTVYNNHANHNSPTSTSHNSTTSDTKFGLAFEIGGKIISYKGWYWGYSFGLGAYIISNYKGADSIYNFAQNWVLIDIEFFKLGYAF